MAVFKRADRGNLFKESTNLEVGQGVILQKLKADMYCKSLALSGPGALLDKEGELLEDNCLKTGQKGTLTLGNVTVGQYHLLLEPNPALLKQCIVRGPRLLEPRESLELSFLLKADSPTNLNDLDYLFRLYIVD